MLKPKEKMLSNDCVPSEELTEAQERVEYRTYNTTQHNEMAALQWITSTLGLPSEHKRSLGEGGDMAAPGSKMNI